MNSSPSCRATDGPTFLHIIMHVKILSLKSFADKLILQEGHHALGKADELNYASCRKNSTKHQEIQKITSMGPNRSCAAHLATSNPIILSLVWFSFIECHGFVSTLFISEWMGQIKKTHDDT